MEEDSEMRELSAEWQRRNRVDRGYLGAGEGNGMRWPIWFAVNEVMLLRFQITAYNGRRKGNQSRTKHTVGGREGAGF